MSSPGSTASLRTANLQRVVGVLRAQEAGEPVTQADIARQTGLAPATVSNIVRELAATGLLEVEPGSGRRGTTVALARSAGLVAGIDFGHSHVAVALGDMTGSLIAEERHRLNAGHPHNEGLDRAHDLLEQLLAGAGLERTAIRTIGLGLPAPMTAGVVRSSAILPGWVGVNAPEAAGKRFGAVVHIDNDANLGALAEHRHGIARGHDSSVFVKVSSGVGAGIVLEDRLFHGNGGTAGEIGHLTLDENGPVCRCGSRGCLEAYTSTVALQSMMQLQMPGRASTRSSAPPATATSRPCAPSRTPASTSGGRWPAWSTCSTRRSWWWAARWPGPASCCSSRPGSGCVATPSTPSRRPPSSPPSSASGPRWSARCCSRPSAPSCSATDPGRTH